MRFLAGITTGLAVPVVLRLLIERHLRKLQAKQCNDNCVHDWYTTSRWWMRGDRDNG